MAIFTAIATAISAAFFAGSAIATSIIAGGLALATSYAVRALTGQPQQQSGADAFGVQGKLAGGGDVPRSFGLGYHVTAGSLVYANTWGNGYDTPNAFLSQVIAVSDLPGERLVGLWVNGAKVTLGEARASVLGADSMGYAVPEYIRPHNGEGAPLPHLYVKFYDGTQTGADLVMLNVSSAQRPYTSAHVGKGVCYVVIHAFNDENLWSGFPTFKFELSGVPLYDPSRDSTVGGSGSQTHGDYGDPSIVRGGDGDNFPAVQIYNLLLGFYYNGAWLYGLQNTSAARLPVSNWIAQIDKCRSTVIGASGPEPSYRTGGQINVNAQLANAIEAFLTGCQGRISEIGGFYKIHLGAPDTPTFTFSDGDILSTETQVYRPFFSLADSVNGIQATYPDPVQGWNTATAPPYYREDLEVLDGDRRLMADPSFDFVPYAEQAQRLQKSAIEEAQRARTHTLSLPPAFWIVEPGDVGEWTSQRNGYDAKQFRVDAMVDRANLDVILSLTEVDPSDYDWDSDADFTPVT
ncbi:phage tail protein [Bradyrhizobium barranii subsp. barranii]|uniref:Phage tail protein n=1 Tax=Bradyrhizobium barranii subsp. barranii TaxID=2823807 RepID=A0A7Z0TQX9_9BRAD|nr:phage tail protein [Bradyrhizobium barranii]UGX98225.1 phage tail protein [Bradyrhizobium barranii subsp. barranii]